MERLIMGMKVRHEHCGPQAALAAPREAPADTESVKNQYINALCEHNFIQFDTDIEVARPAGAGGILGEGGGRPPRRSRRRARVPRRRRQPAAHARAGPGLPRVAGGHEAALAEAGASSWHAL
jgi:hypothetical protein